MINSRKSNAGKKEFLVYKNINHYRKIWGRIITLRRVMPQSLQDSSSFKSIRANSKPVSRRKEEKSENHPLIILFTTGNQMWRLPNHPGFNFPTSWLRYCTNAIQPKDHLRWLRCWSLLDHLFNPLSRMISNLRSIHLTKRKNLKISPSKEWMKSCKTSKRRRKLKVRSYFGRTLCLSMISNVQQTSSILDAADLSEYFPKNNITNVLRSYHMAL